MKWKQLPIVAFDTETTGLEPFRGDRIIEFAAVVLHIGEEGHASVVQEYARLVNPGIPIPRAVTEITGIGDGDVADAPSFEELADEIHALLHGVVSVAHNYPFDLAFLTAAYTGLGLERPHPLAEVDTVDVSMARFPDARSHKLSDVTKRLGIVLEGAHRATNDAAACGQAFIEMARRDDVPDDLQAMLDWARAIGQPPDDGPLGADVDGRIVFTEGPHAGEPVHEHPVHLAWMDQARQRTPDGWRFRYDERTRRWVRRWLEVRGAGRARQNPKSFRASDWTLDPSITLPRRAG